jgi:hypothetical protein
VIFADGSDFLRPSESGNGFYDAHDNIQKLSHEEQVKKESTRESKRAKVRRFSMV